jgi:hypothetical protein
MVGATRESITEPSCEAAKTCCPSGLKATSKTWPLKPVKMVIVLLLATSQIRTVPSAEAVAILAPSELNRARVTPFECPANAEISLNVLASQIRALPSYEEVRIRVPSALNSALVTLLSHVLIHQANLPSWHPKQSLCYHFRP